MNKGSKNRYKPAKTREDAAHLTNFSFGETRKRNNYYPRDKIKTPRSPMKASNAYSAADTGDIIRKYGKVGLLSTRMTVSISSRTASEYDYTKTFSRFPEWNNIKRCFIALDGGLSLRNPDLKCCICLDHFKVPRITSCGHIFCYSCLMRMILTAVREREIKSSSCGLNKRSPMADLPLADWFPRYQILKHLSIKCPLCSSLFDACALRPVTFYSGKTEKSKQATSKSVSFVLMRRRTDERVCFIANKEDVFERLPFVHESYISRRILRITKNGIEGTAHSYLKDDVIISPILVDSGGEISSCLKDDIDSIDEELNDASNDSMECNLLVCVKNSVLRESEVLLQGMNGDEVYRSLKNSFSLNEFKTFYLNIESSRNQFLNNFCMKQISHDLKFKEKDVSKLPLHLNSCFVLDKESYSSISEEFLSKFTFMQYLMAGNNVDFLEVDLSHILAPEVLETYKSEINRRKKQRQKKRQKEKKDQMKIKKRNDEKEKAMLMQSRVFNSDDMTPETKQFLLETANTSKNVSELQPSLIATRRLGNQNLKRFSNIVSTNGYFPALGTSNKDIASNSSKQKENENLASKVKGKWSKPLSSAEIVVGKRDLGNQNRLASGWAELRKKSR